MKKKATIAVALVMLAGVGLCQEVQPRGSEMAAVPLVLAKEKLPEFEVADIQPGKPTPDGPKARFLPGGRVEFHNLPMKFMVLAAWGWENDEGRVTGGPGWVNSDQYDIVAKAPPTSDIATLRLMLRALLIKRFGLEYHIEDQMLPVYTLEKGKGEPKVKQSAKEGSPDCKRSSEDDMITMTCSNMTMDELANGLRGVAPAYIDKPVVNLTGLSGQFDFKLGWTPRGRLLGNEGRGAAESGARPDGSVLNASDSTGGLTVFEGIDKYMGLKMTSTKHAMPVIVIDKVNKTATEN